MAGIEIDLSALDALEAWMREHRASYARVGEYELHLDPPAPPPVYVGPDQPPADPDEEERRSLETLLYSAGVDPEPFLSAMKRRA